MNPLLKTMKARVIEQIEAFYEAMAMDLEDKMDILIHNSDCRVNVKVVANIATLREFFELMEGDFWSHVGIFASDMDEWLDEIINKNYTHKFMFPKISLN